MARADLLKQLFRDYRDSDRESLMHGAHIESARQLLDQAKR